MPASFRSKGAYGVGTTSCVAAAPTGGNAPQVNDILIIPVESSDSTTAAGTPNTPAGWTKLFEESQGAGATGVTTLTIFGKRAGASEGDVTIDGVLNHCSATMLVYKDSLVTGDAWQVGTGNGADTGNGTILGITTPVDNCLVLMICCSTRDAINSTNWTGWTNANLSGITEREDNTTNTATGGGFGVADGLKVAAGATGDSTVTIAVSVQWRAVHIALKPLVLAEEVPLPEIPYMDETYEESQPELFSGWLSWQVPEDVVVLDQVWAELPNIDDTYLEEHEYNGLTQSPLAADAEQTPTLSGEFPVVDETYIEEQDYSGFVAWQVPDNVEDFQPLAENPFIDETYIEEQDYSGYVTWQVPANIEDFQSLPDTPVIDELFEAEYDYSGFVAWQVPGNVEDFQPLAEAPIIDQTYEEEYSYAGFTNWQIPFAIEDPQPQPEFPVIDATYEEEHDYSGQFSWQTPENIQDFQPLADLPVVDESYYEEHDYSGWVTWQVGADNVEDFQPLAELPIIDETYQEEYSYDGYVTWQVPANVEDTQSLGDLIFIDQTYEEDQDYTGQVGWQVPDDIQDPLLGILECPQIDESYELLVEFFGWQSIVVVEDLTEEPPPFMVLPQMDTIDLYYEYTEWQAVPLPLDVATFSGPGNAEVITANPLRLIRADKLDSLDSGTSRTIKANPNELISAKRRKNIRSGDK